MPHFVNNVPDAAIHEIRTQANLCPGIHKTLVFQKRQFPHQTRSGEDGRQIGIDPGSPITAGELVNKFSHPRGSLADDSNFIFRPPPLQPPAKIVTQPASRGV